MLKYYFLIIKNISSEDKAFLNSKKLMRTVVNRKVLFSFYICSL